MSIGHEGLGDRYRQLRLIAALFQFFTPKPPIEAASGLLALGNEKSIEAAATRASDLKT